MRFNASTPWSEAKQNHMLEVYLYTVVLPCCVARRDICDPSALDLFSFIQSNHRIDPAAHSSTNPQRVNDDQCLVEEG